MDHYSDEDQVEAIKKWWQENGKSVVTGVVLAIAGVLGVQYWKAYRQDHFEQASLYYDALTASARRGDTEAAREHGQSLIDGYGDSAYAALGSLVLAKADLEAGDEASAIERLQWVVENAEMAGLAGIARLRLARIALTQGRLDDAAAALEGVSAEHHPAQRAELEGDLHAARGEPQAAREDYIRALAAREPGGLRTVLELKLSNLPPAEAAEG